METSDYPNATFRLIIKEKHNVLTICSDFQKHSKTLKTGNEEL